MTFEYLIKSNEKTDSKFGKKPTKRNFKEILEKGIIIIDKNSGPTSHQIVDNLKKILGIKKAGHSGTLDPKVTGVLVCGLGKGTKLMEYILTSGKEYICLMYVHREVDEDLLRETILSFQGKIRQKPPVVSAVKRVERTREIYNIDILDIYGQYVLFRAEVEHGTYMRKLCHDIGLKLGTGAHMVELRRTKAGGFSENESINLTKLEDLIDLYKKFNSSEEKVIKNNTDNSGINSTILRKKVEDELKKYIHPIEYGLRNIKKVYIKDSAVGMLSYGGDLAIPGVVKLEKGIKKGDIVALLTLKDELVSIGTALLDDVEVIDNSKGFFVKTTKTFLEPGIYPIPWKKKEK